jgi:catechol 2,3-dioxygenase-like lactoylglutathione lyase family enzyme
MITIKDSNVTINVKDLNASIKFYQSIGFTLKNHWGNYYAQLSAAGITIGLHPKIDINSVGNTDNISIGFTVENFENIKQILKSLNIETSERKEEGGEFIHFNDLDGTPLYFIKPKW